MITYAIGRHYQGSTERQANRLFISLLCCLAAVAGGAQAQTTLAPGAGVINTVAGNGTACSNYSTTGCGNGGRATGAELKNAFGVAVDTHFNIYIADTADNVIREVSVTTGDIQTVAGNGTVCAPSTSACGDGGPATSAQLNAPRGVEVDSSGNIFIADFGDNKIRKVSGGTITTVAGNGSACTYNPTTQCGDGGLATSAQLDSPEFLALDSSGNIYLTDTGYEVIREVKTTGDIFKVAGTYGTPGNTGDGESATNATLNQPEGVVVDTEGNLYIADTVNNRIREVSAGTINNVAGASAGTVCPGSTENCGDGGAATSAKLNNPWGVAVDSSFNIYIADTYDYRIRVVTQSTGLINTVAGNGTAGFTGDATAAIHAEIQPAFGIAVDSLGNIYFPDETDSRIRAVGSTTFTTTGSMNVARMWDTATLLQNGLVLITGGCATCEGDATAFASAELYNPATGTFALTGSMNVARYLHTATLLPSGLVLIAGGETAGGGVGSTSAELYNPATGTFTSTGSMNVAREQFTATLLQNGTVLIAGGAGGLWGVSSAEVYNPATGAFTSIGPMNDPHYGHTATLLPNGSVLVAGSAGGYTTVAELYNPTTGAFTLTGSLNNGGRGHVATLLPDGLVLVAGGAGNSSSAELYSPATGMFTPTGSMNAEREYFTATSLQSGLVLVAGGDGASGLQASAELYDPITAAFTWTSSMSVARQYQTATILPSGLVLMAGGEGSGGALASAELY